MLQPQRQLRFLILPLLFLHHILAQDADDTSQTPVPPTTNPDTLMSNAPLPPETESTTSNVAQPTASAGTHDIRHRDGLLNYYFLILAVFVVILCLIYYSLSRRRRLAHRQSQNHQTHALHQDLSYPHNHSTGAGRWRRWRPMGGSRDTTFGTSSEGLNERGEAPPPYIKEPDRAHLGSRGSQSTHDMELGNWASQSGKPPDYDGGGRFVQ